MKNNLTYTTKASDIKREWWHVDVAGEVLGRAASEIAQLLIGKKKPYYTPSLDCGDYVVVTNIDRVEVTGKKAKQKMYYRHSGYPGGFRETPYNLQMKKDPRKVLIFAVKNMLPKNKLRSLRLKRLKVFVGEAHEFNDKKPKKYSIIG